ncbi:MAG: FHA domain-containing protein [Proteobacteria bacterium]|nr:FHA domain-containing protein [Pseudomonadota bacterium]
MRVSVEIRVPSGETVSLGHGALIGRLWSADLQLNDARISEAHAMISLRGRDVQLLALRGRFAVDGRTVSKVVLRAGMVIALAANLEIEVLSVRVPDTVLAVEAAGMARQVLSGVTSIFGKPRPRVVAGWHPDASDYVWPTGVAWLREPSTPIAPGDTWQVDGVEFRAIEERVGGVDATVGEVSFDRPLTIIARYDTVHVVRQDEPVVVISGHMARVISDLVTAGAPISWQDLAEGIWGAKDKDLLRRRWDMQLVRLRQKLRNNGVRQDLLRADGSGLLDLVLGPGDKAVDET